MRFQLLGPLRIRQGDAWVPVRAAQPRLVLALLLIDAGRIVTVDRLIDEIWSDRPPPTANNTIQGYVMRLRRLLHGDKDGPLLTRPGGYELVIGDADLDVVAFERLVDAGKRELAGNRLDGAIEQLSRALRLWQAPALADVPASPTVTAEATRLERRRLTAMEDQLTAEVGLGRHAEVVDELHRLVEKHPLREGLQAQLILALYRCGRRADALDAYRKARRLLIKELGLEPGPELRELHEAILNDDQQLRSGRRQSAAAVTLTRQVAPAQLPAKAIGFTGRGAYLRRLDAQLPAPGADEPGGLAILTISGTAGVGKTTLAVHWAHQVRDRFPDGQLYLDLRGYSAGRPLRPLDALATLLPALGVPPEQVPGSEAEAAALYRSLLAGKRVLVLLDNAANAGQVRPLLPAGHGCVVLVTSRDRLGGLVARDGASACDLDVLTQAEADALLSRLLGGLAVAETTTATIAELCGYLPLALRIAAANLLALPGSVTDYLKRLRADRLSSLEIDDDPQSAVRSAFELSYDGQPPAAQRLFRLLGLVPGPDFSCRHASALAGLSAGETTGLLGRLVVAHLVEERGADRYGLHDLLRTYAAEQSELDSAAERADAIGSLYEHYQRRLDAAARQLYPQILRLPAAEPAAESAGFETDVEARAWLDAERAGLVAAVQHATTDGPPDVAWRLADGMRGYLYLGRQLIDWQTVAEAGLNAAEAAGDELGQASAHLSLASLQRARGRYRQAIEHHKQALSLARRGGWRDGESAALGNLGAVHWALGELSEAARHYASALAIDVQTGWLSGQAAKLDNLGGAYHGLGRLASAAEQHARAVAINRQVGSRGGLAMALAHLGETYHALGQLTDALEALTEALALHRELGARSGEANALRVVAAVYSDLGRRAEALEHADAAVSLAREAGEPRLEADALNARARLEPAVAVRDYRQALHLARRIGSRYAEIEALTGLAQSSDEDLFQALEYGETAVALAQHGGYRLLAGQALTALAAVQLRRDRRALALDLVEQALAVHAETGHRPGAARTHLVAAEALDGTGMAEAHRTRALDILRAAGASLP